MQDYSLAIQILKNQVTPALGCTEPGAVALAVARAKALLGEPPVQVSILVDKNVLKNGMDVGIPGTNEHGIVFAAALALVVGRSEYGLEVLRDVRDADIPAASALAAKKIITLALDEAAQGLSIKVEMRGADTQAKVFIQKLHTNIVYEEKDGLVLLDTRGSRPQASAQKAAPPADLRSRIQEFSIAGLVALCNTVPAEEIAFLEEGIIMNRRIAEAGIAQNFGIGMGRYFAGNACTPAERAKALTAAASEARMAGCPLPVMSSAGSGNHGLVAILPIAIIGESLGCQQEKLLRAVALSHLVTIYVKSYLGSLSPVCGCGVAAGVGCAAGLVYLRDGGTQQICDAINNMVAGISGMICDGAKLGCSYKLSIAADAAVDAAGMALQGISIPANNGILGPTAEDTIQNLAQVSNVGMNNTDNIILDVMLHKCL